MAIRPCDVRGERVGWRETAFGRPQRSASSLTRLGWANGRRPMASGYRARSAISSSTRGSRFPMSNVPTPASAHAL